MTSGVAVFEWDLPRQTSVIEACLFDVSMKPERWKQIDQLLDSALRQEVCQRAAFLEKACAGDEELRREVESQLTRSKLRASLKCPP
jgi:hypothetical protein